MKRNQMHAMFRMSISFFKENKMLIFIVGVFLFLKVFYLIKPHVVGWDEAVYLGIGKYLYSLGRVGLWEIIRPIGLPLVLGLFWKLKLDFVFFSELLINLFAISNIILVYLLGKKLFHKNVGIISSLLIAFTPQFFSHSSLILTSIPSTFFVLLAFYFYVLDKRFLWIGLFLGAGIFFRFPQGLAFAAFLVLILFSKERNDKKIRNILGLTGGALITLLPFLVFNYLLYRQYTGNIFDALFRPFIFGALHQASPFHPGGFGFYFKALFQQNYLFLFAVLGLVISWKKKINWLLAVLFFYLFYFSLIANKQGRFMLTFLPYVCLLAGIGLYNSFLFLRKQKRFYISLMSLFWLLVVFSLMPVASEVQKDYLWRPQEELPAVGFFRNFSYLDGMILTTNPVPVAYADQLFIPFYDNPDVALQVYNRFEDNASYILYFPRFYPCLDEGCELQKDLLYEKISKHELLVENEFGEYNYLLFKIT